MVVVLEFHEHFTEFQQSIEHSICSEFLNFLKSWKFWCTFEAGRQVEKLTHPFPRVESYLFQVNSPETLFLDGPFLSIFKEDVHVCAKKQIPISTSSFFRNG